MRRGGGGVIATALVVATLLLALSFVTWRQSRARESMAELDRLQREMSLIRAEKAEFERRIQQLESRGHVLPAAREALGLRTPGADEIIILTDGDPTPGGRPESDTAPGSGGNR